MRLTPKQQATIRDTVHRLLGPEVRVYLFGSRVDDAARGGDIDIYVESDRPIERRAVLGSRVAAQLQLALGDQRIDVLIADPESRRHPIHRHAASTGVPL